MVSKLQSSSAELEKLMQAKRSIEANELERVEATLDRAIELSQLFTQAALLVAGFHTHKRQWRRKRDDR
jgi:predicted negative regulator of RcsB-dependent stress response